MLHLEIKKTPDGRTLARRKDGQPLTAEDREQARRIIDVEEPLHTFVVREVCEDGKLKAVEVRSSVLEDHLWLAFDHDFRPADALAVYYADELPALKNFSLEQLRQIHAVKLAFPLCRIIQERAE